MDKNNDIQVNKVDKWCEGVADVSLLQAKKSVDMFLCCYSPMLSIEALDAVRTIYVYLDEALDRFNELEAKYNTDCGMISDYAEENAQLKLKNEKASNNIRELRQALAENDIVTCMDPITGSWGVGNVALQKKTEHFNIQLDNLRERLREAERNKEDALRKMIQEVAELEKENDELKSAENRCKVYRNSYERTVNDVCKLQEFLEKCGVPVKYRNDGTWYWDFENSAWDDTLMKDCKLIDKCRELEKENNNLTTDNKRLNNAVEAWFDMFIDMRHKHDLLKKEYKKLKETNKSCPVACECENFKPKVHHSYDPLDDLPDMEHS